MHQSNGKLACTLKVLRDTQNSCILLNLKETLLSLGPEIPNKFLDGSLAATSQGTNKPFLNVDGSWENYKAILNEEQLVSLNITGKTT